MAARPASSNPAAMRQSKLVGAEGIGPRGRFGGLGGSITPMPVNLRGGPPPCADEACGSNSGSYSAKSCGMKLNVTPMPAERLEQPEHRFDGHPGRHGTSRCVQRRHEFPAANGLHGPVIESQSNSSHNADLRRPAVRANQNQQRHRPLQLRLARFVGILRIRAIRAFGPRDARPIRSPRHARSRLFTWRTPDGIIRTVADRVAFSPAGRIVSIWHPRQANVVHRLQLARSRGVQNRRRNRQLRILVLWQRGFQELDR